MQSNKSGLLNELKIQVLEFVKNSHNIQILQECKGPEARDCDIFLVNIILISLTIEAKNPPKISILNACL